jgi:UDP-N-acetylmuramoyl-L-alanyl-D-glutamate--2,6-diaminopimelate ligase
MRLEDLLRVMERPVALPREVLDREVRDITHDSRKVIPGSLFVAVRGFHSDGHQFISQAFKRGAVAVVAEHGATDTTSADAVVLVEDTRRALALLAGAFYGHPSRRLKLIGVTGTNGKTTTTYLVKAIVEAAGSASGLIGTIDYRVGGRVYPAPNTTPDALDLQRLLAEMADLGASFCIMEASSHALELGRTVGCDFAAAAFTNLTHDHLDFHKTMESYFRAKLQLFTGLSPDAVAVVNADDARAAEIVGATRARVITTGMTQAANVRPSGTIRHGLNGLSFSAATPAGTVPVESPLVGRHNIYNILTAIGLGIAMGFEAGVIAAGIANMKAVPGRMEKVAAGQPFGVIVDYAHTEDALVRLLEAAREITEGRIITVFGCGGDRDRTTRPKMGAAAAKGSDIVIVTSDNPRTEDPLAIIGEIEGGMAAGAVRVVLPAEVHPGADGMTPYVVVPDRRRAIAEAVSMAKPGDVVVIAGKGHEDYQLIGEKKIHFDDREVAREEIGRFTVDRGLVQKE